MILRSAIAKAPRSPRPDNMETQIILETPTPAPPPSSIELCTPTPRALSFDSCTPDKVTDPRNTIQDGPVATDMKQDHEEAKLASAPATEVNHELAPKASMQAQEVSQEPAPKASVLAEEVTQEPAPKASVLAEEVGQEPAPKEQVNQEPAPKASPCPNSSTVNLAPAPTPEVFDAASFEAGCSNHIIEGACLYANCVCHVYLCVISAVCT